MNSLKKNNYSYFNVKMISRTKYSIIFYITNIIIVPRNVYTCYINIIIIKT